VTVALEILHIAVAAAWFGSRLLIPADVSASIHDDRSPTLFIARVGRARRLSWISGVLTLLTGLGLMQLTSGLFDAPWTIYAGLVAAVVMLGVGWFVAGPPWKRIRDGLERGDAPTASASVPRFRQALTLESLLWLLALGSMIVT
jgi:hypothetical protein